MFFLRRGFFVKNISSGKKVSRSCGGGAGCFGRVTCGPMEFFFVYFTHKFRGDVTLIWWMWGSVAAIFLNRKKKIWRMIERRKKVKKKNVQAFCDEGTFELKKLHIWNPPGPCKLADSHINQNSGAYCVHKSK